MTREAFETVFAHKDLAGFSTVKVSLTTGIRTPHWHYHNRTVQALWEGWQCGQANKQMEIDKLQLFKDYVHRRLNDAGVPTHPDGEHSKAGCRIGDRLDIALKRSTLEDRVTALEKHSHAPITFVEDENGFLKVAK